MKSMLNGSTSIGMIITMIRKCAEKVAPTIAAIQDKLTGKQVCDFNETGYA